MYLVIVKSLLNLIYEYDSKEEAIEAAKRFIARGLSVRIAKELPIDIDVKITVGGE